MKYISVLFFVTLITYACSAQKRCTGCVDDIDFKEAEKFLNHYLTKLSKDGGPQYTIIDITSATLEEFDGYIFRISAVLIDQDQNIRKCNNQILTQPWSSLDISVTFDCAGEEKISRVYNFSPQPNLLASKKIHLM